MARSRQLQNSLNANKEYLDYKYKRTKLFVLGFCFICVLVFFGYAITIAPDSVPNVIKLLHDLIPAKNTFFTLLLISLALNFILIVVLIKLWKKKTTMKG